MLMNYRQNKRKYSFLIWILLSAYATMPDILHAQQDSSIYLYSLPVGSAMAKRAIDRSRIGSWETRDKGITYPDFGNPQKEDYLVYRNSPHEITIGMSLFSNIKLASSPQEQLLIDDSSLKLIPDDKPPTIMVGYRRWDQQPNKEGRFYDLQLHLLHLTAQQIINAHTSSEPFLIQRGMDIESYRFIASAGQRVRRFHYFIGLETAYLRSNYKREATFIFGSLEGVEDIIPNPPNIEQVSENEVLFRQPIGKVSEQFLNFRLFWQIGYKMPLTDNLSAGIQLNNLIPFNVSLNKPISDKPSYDDTPWLKNYLVDYEVMELIQRDYLQLILSYHFNRKKRIQNRLGLE